MIAVPKLLRCYDCDSFIDRRRTQAHCDCHACPDSASLARQQLADRPLCLFCEEFRTQSLLCEKEMV